MNQKTALFDIHRKAGAKLVEFGGWDMPLHYGSQIREHLAVRQDAGMFDVSHMSRVDLRGPAVRPFLRRLLANNVDKLVLPGKALYSCMLNEQGGVIDDLITYYLADDWFRLVINAATRDTDLVWMREQAGRLDGVELAHRADLSMIAVQGPQARDKTFAALGEAVEAAASPLPAFVAVDVDGYFVARTGYTGEDGFEIVLANERAPAAWEALRETGVVPCGLGARDTLRLEAGMNLYGSDMDTTTTPLESALGWTVAWEPEDRDFVGRDALERQREHGLTRKLVGLVLMDKGVLRSHQSVHWQGCGAGEITSGSFSPTLGRSIALARVSASLQIGDTCQVRIRDKLLNAKVVKHPFVRRGKSCLNEI